VTNSTNLTLHKVSRLDKPDPSQEAKVRFLYCGKFDPSQLITGNVRKIILLQFLCVRALENLHLQVARFLVYPIFFIVSSTDGEESRFLSMLINCSGLYQNSVTHAEAFILFLLLINLKRL
jgi:hypothetical protein